MRGEGGEEGRGGEEEERGGEGRGERGEEGRGVTCAPSLSSFTSGAGQFFWSCCKK